MLVEEGTELAHWSIHHATIHDGVSGGNEFSLFQCTMWVLKVGRSCLAMMWVNIIINTIQTRKMSNQISNMLCQRGWII